MPKRCRSYMHMKTADLSSTILLTADSYAKKSSAPSVWGSTPGHLPRRPQQREFRLSSLGHLYCEEGDHLSDREPPRLQVNLRRPIDVELRGLMRQITVSLLLNLVTNRRRFGVIDQAEALVALADPFP